MKLHKRNKKVIMFFISVQEYLAFCQLFRTQEETRELARQIVSYRPNQLVIFGSRSADRTPKRGETIRYEKEK